MANPDVVVRVAQLSDTHFVEEGLEPEGGFGYDTALGQHPVDGFDSVVVIFQYKAFLLSLKTLQNV